MWLPHPQNTELFKLKGVFLMYAMQISTVQDELGMYPTMRTRVIPSWMVAEHYENCENGLFCRLRKFLKK
jgi:hypothetical protein